MFIFFFFIYLFVFFFNDTATTEIYTLSLHDALRSLDLVRLPELSRIEMKLKSTEPEEPDEDDVVEPPEIGEHTSELQSHHDLVCRLLLEKKKKKYNNKKNNKKKKKKAE